MLDVLVNHTFKGKSVAKIKRQRLFPRKDISNEGNVRSCENTEWVHFSSHSHKQTKWMQVQVEIDGKVVLLR